MKMIDTVVSVTDPVMQEVRRNKLAIAEEFGFDIIALGRSLQERQAHDPRFTKIKDEQVANGKPLELHNPPSNSPQ